MHIFNDFLISFVARFNMFLKLFVALGLTWSLEIIAWIIISTDSDVPEWFTVVLNLANILQGIVVFMIFGLKATARRDMKKRVDSMNLRRRLSHKSNSENTSEIAVSFTRRNSDGKVNVQGVPLNQPPVSFNPNG